jgi:hypothetical protein
MFVSVLTLFLILRRLGLKVKMFPRYPQRQEKGGCILYFGAAGKGSALPSRDVTIE